MCVCVYAVERARGKKGERQIGRGETEESDRTSEEESEECNGKNACDGVQTGGGD